MWGLSVQSPSSVFLNHVHYRTEIHPFKQSGCIKLCPTAQQTDISAKQRWAIWKPFLIQYCCSGSLLKSVSALCSPSSRSLQGSDEQTKCWLCVALPESSDSLYLSLCPLPDSSVATIVNPTPAAPVLSAKTLPGAECWKMPLLLFTEREKNIWFNYRVCQASLSLWWPELSCGEIKPSS